MLVSVSKFPNEAIILVKYSAPFFPTKDIVAAQEKIADILSENEGDFYRIDDLSEAEMDWNAFVEGIFIATRDVAGSMTDKRIQGVLVGESSLIKMASESMKQNQYGAKPTPMFHTLDDALRHIR